MVTQPNPEAQYKIEYSFSDIEELIPTILENDGHFFDRPEMSRLIEAVRVIKEARANGELVCRDIAAEKAIENTLANQRVDIDRKDRQLALSEAERLELTKKSQALIEISSVYKLGCLELQDAVDNSHAELVKIGRTIGNPSPLDSALAILVAKLSDEYHVLENAAISEAAKEYDKYIEPARSNLANPPHAVTA